MNISEIEKKVHEVVQSFSKETFIYDLLRAYGIPKGIITRLQNGDLNLSKQISGEIDWKKKLFFKELETEDLHETIDIIRKSPKFLKHDPRFIIVTDYKNLLAVDRKTEETLDIKLKEIDNYVHFFLPWAGMEKTQHQNENPADVKAAERMAKLYDEIKKDNPTSSEEEVHSLNVFLSRLLFCFFAEDTGIFELGQFTNAIASHTQSDGSDLNTYLDNLFEVLNTDKKHRKNLPAYLNGFDYVNGGLFRDKLKAPIFTRRSRQAIIDSGELNWSAINPDIFGSMIQAVITPEHRGGLGMHYTSVPNIMKVIEPLFLNELNEEFENGKNEPRKLNELLDRISDIKIFDPACGSGNFLIIAYKELRQLEIKILKQLQLLQKAASGFEPHQLELIPKSQLTLAKSFQVSLFSRIELSQFYGIELDDFAHEIATLSLWLAQHQMNLKFKEVFGTTNPTLPLHAGGNIVHGNATRINWEKVCPKIDGDETYILGNPPYLGAKELNKSQQEDTNIVLTQIGNVKRLDYIACWFKKATDYIDKFTSKYAFVSTDSITQGEQVELIWPYILSYNQEIFYAHKSFKWSNNAKNNAGVSVVILGIQNNNIKKLSKKIYDGNRFIIVDNISPYITGGGSVIMRQRTEPISKFPKMILCSSGFDGGYLILNSKEKEDIISKYPEGEKFIRKFLSGNDFLNDKIRFCLWIDDELVNEAKKIPPILERINKCKEFRLGAGRDAKKAALVPHRFFYRTHSDSPKILFPKTTSGRRNYVPVGFIQNDIIISNASFIINNAEPYIFAILSSRMHNVWLSVTSARMNTSFRYSVNFTYNTFPFPIINDIQKKEFERHVFCILEEREKHSQKTLAQLYDPDKMPKDLKEAHHQLDLAIEHSYRSRPFDNDEERLEYLFKSYEQMIAEEKERSGELIFEQPKPKKKKTNHA